jgi:hypothetical protein
MKKFKNYVLWSVFAAMLVACSGPEEKEVVNLVEKRTLMAEDSLETAYRRTKGDAHGGNYFSRTDSIDNYGLGTVFQINDSLLSQDIKIKVNFWGRVNTPGTGCLYVLSLNDGENTVSWNQIDITNRITEANKWVNVVDSVTIPGNLVSKTGLRLSAYSFNTNKGVVFDVDDLELSIYSVSKILVE